MSPKWEAIAASECEGFMATRSLVVMIAPALLLLFASGTAYAQPPSVSAVRNEVTSDFKYIVNNAFLDAEDVVTSQLYVTSPDSALRSPRFYLVLSGAGAVRLHWTRRCAVTWAA
jgi:hypothetical protein